ncbi:hypothetical protein OHX02_00630 [Acinetobacter baumannii]|nr:hypothetical protein [Acinetobacter baumannii]
MDNYKIKVKDEAQSKEAQELFFELGFQWYKEDKGVFWETTSGFIFANGNTKRLMGGVFMDADAYAPVTIPQLRDLVVLKRNDINDANWETEGGDQIFKDSNDKSFIYRSDGWDELLRHEMRQAMWEKPKAIAKPQDPALISGAEAELVEQAKKFITSDHLNRFEAAEAHLEGHPVQFMLANGDFIDITSDTTLGIFEKDGGYSFRLKPQTIKVELELPKPFEPEEDCHVYILDDGKTDGYRRYSYEVHGDKGNTFIGIWRTEEEIKQVVEQLRKIRGTNS